MEKLNFTNNVDFVRVARELFTNDYRLSIIYSENGEAINCAYRLSIRRSSSESSLKLMASRRSSSEASLKPMAREGKEEPARCLIGRMFYGHIPEEHDFWNYDNDIIHAREEFEIVNELFPWLDDEVASEIQAYHDKRAGLCDTDLVGWDTLEIMARLADEAFSEGFQDE